MRLTGLSAVVLSMGVIATYATSTSASAATSVAPPDAFPAAPAQHGDGVSWRTLANGDVRCVYRSDELIAPVSEATNLASTIGATLLFPILDDPPPGAPDLALYALPPAAPDPLDLAASPPAPLVAGELWPNYVAGFTPGWAFAPGGAPSPTSAPASVYAPSNSGSGVSILVVDTGFAAPGGAPELAGLGRREDVLIDVDYGALFQGEVDRLPHAVAADEGDVLTGRAAGHGTFVAGLLERSIPEAAVHVLPAPFRDARDIAFSVPSAASGKPGPASAESSITDDARLAKAIEAQYDADPSAVEILNLSLGTYGCGMPPERSGPGRDVLRPPSMRALLLTLHEDSPDMVVVASAGNDQSADRFYPAAFADDACFQATPVRACQERVGRPANTQSPWLIAVGSDDPSYSNFGDWVTVQARAAPTSSACARRHGQTSAARARRTRRGGGGGAAPPSRRRASPPRSPSTARSRRRWLTCCGTSRPPVEPWSAASNDPDAFVERRITGFAQDDVGDWVALLDCHHRQHVRHHPPLWPPCGSSTTIRQHVLVRPWHVRCAIAARFRLTSWSFG